MPRFFWPLRSLFAPWELRWLMRQMPTTPRLWVPTTRGIRPESDAEYLSRLRERARERRLERQRQGRDRRAGPTDLDGQGSPEPIRVAGGVED